MQISDVIAQLRTTDLAACIRFYTALPGFTLAFQYGDFYGHSRRTAALSSQARRYKGPLDRGRGERRPFAPVFRHARCDGGGRGSPPSRRPASKRGAPHPVGYAGVRRPRRPGAHLVFRRSELGRTRGCDRTLISLVYSVACALAGDRPACRRSASKFRNTVARDRAFTPQQDDGAESPPDGPKAELRFREATQGAGPQG